MHGRARNPTRRFFAEHCGCGAMLSEAGQELAKEYDYIDIPPIRPITTRVELFRATCPCCRSWALRDRAARGRVCGGYATTRPCPETPWFRATLPASAGLRRQNPHDASAIGC